MLEDTAPIQFKLTPIRILSILGANVLISLFIVAIHPETNLLVSLIYAQCIGISIATCTIATTRLFKTPKFVYQVALITAAVIAGAVIGMVVAAPRSAPFPGCCVHCAQNENTSSLFPTCCTPFSSARS
jgi:hypothetical protein